MSAEDQQALASRLKDARKFLNLTRDFVANQVGLSLSAIGEIERGTRRVESIELSKLARLYRLSPEYLLTGSDATAASSVVEAALARATRQMTEDERGEVLRFALFLQNYKSSGGEGPPR